MPHVMNRTGASGRLKRTIEDWQVLSPQTVCTFNRARLLDVGENGSDILRRVAETCEGRLDRVVRDLNHASANQLLEFHQGKIGFDARSVTIHHEADCAGGRQNGDLRIAIAKALPQCQRLVPNGLASAIQAKIQLVEFCIIETGERLTMHPDYIEERLTIEANPGACTSCDYDLLASKKLSCRGHRRASLSHDGRLFVCFTTHQGGDAGGVATPSVGIV